MGLIRPRLVHVTTSTTADDSSLPIQLAAFREQGYDVTAIGAPGEHIDALDAAGIPFLPAGSPGIAGGGRAAVQRARHVSALLEGLDPHIVHNHDPEPGTLARLVGARRAGPIHVSTVHELAVTSVDTPRRRVAAYAAEALRARLSSVELVANIEDLLTLRNLGAPRSRLVHLGQGVDLDRFRETTATRARGLRLRRHLGISPIAFVVGMIGTDSDRACRDFLATIDDLRRGGYVGIEFVVVPSRPNALPERLSSRLRNANVRLCEPDSYFENVLASLDVAVVSSESGGGASVAMRAHAMGLPIVASDVRGIRQVVADGVTGALVPAGHTRAVARAIAQLHDSPGTCRAMAHAAVARAHHRFDQNRVIDVTLGVYRNQLEHIGIVEARREPIIDLRQVTTEPRERVLDLTASDSVA